MAEEAALVTEAKKLFEAQCEVNRMHDMVKASNYSAQQSDLPSLLKQYGHAQKALFAAVFKFSDD